MKKINILIIAFIILAILLQEITVIANVVNLGEIKYVERGDLGFYSIQYFNKEKNQWMYVTYSRTYYTDDNGEKRIAYCTTPDLDGVGWLPGEANGYDTTITEKLTNEKLWRVFKNGYPYSTPQELGVENEDDAYLATKQAAYFIIKGRGLDDVNKYFRPGEISINGENLADIQRRGKKVIDAIYRLVNIGYNNSESIGNPKIEKVGELEIEENSKDFYKQKYKLTNTGPETTIQINGIKTANHTIDTKYIEIRGDTREVKNYIRNGDNFYIEINKNAITSDEKIIVNYTVTYKDYPIYFAKSSIENTQDYLMTAEKVDTEKGSFSLDINAHQSSIKIVKQDSENKQNLENVIFNIKYENGENLGNFTTDSKGEININKILPGKIYVTELEAPNNYVIDKVPKEINLEFGQSYTLNIENNYKKGKIKIIKTSEDNNSITHAIAGARMAGVKFGIYDSKGKLIQEIVTDKEGIAISDSLKIGKYIVKEIDSGRWYLLNKSIYNVELKDNEEIVTLDIKNTSANPKVNIDKNGPSVAKVGKEIKYDFNIKNSGNVPLAQFTWYDNLPYQYSKITKISTGTYNQDITYNLYYKTNKKSDYILMEENLSSKTNNYIDLTKILLEKDERITEIKASFGNVNIGFKSEDNPNIFLKLDENIDENLVITNNTNLDGYYNDYKVCSEDKVDTVIDNKKEVTKKLPRTGF